MKRKKLLIKAAGFFAVIAIFAVMFGFGVFWQARAEAAQERVNNTYRRAFYDLAQNAEDMYAAILKCALASEPYQLVRLSAEISQYAAAATANLGQIPLDTEPLENISKFLSQAGDYAHMMSLNHLDNTPITKEETATLNAFSSYAEALSGALSDISKDLSDGTILISETEQKLEQLQDLSSGFSEIEHSEFSDYPALIYDGMFSEHVNTMQSIMLNSFEEVDEASALFAAQTAIGKAVRLKCTGQIAGQIPAHCFSGDDGDTHYSVEVSLRGGKSINMMASRPIGTAVLKPEEALDVAAAYLNKTGVFGMQENYYEISGGSITINYAYVQDGVVMYPDLVKVKIALDNGDVIGYEAHGYLMNHRARTLITPKISTEEASAHLRHNFKVQQTRRAIIPTDFGAEIDCYEFKGTYGEHTFFVYVNTQTGREENILLLINTQNGTLTV